MDAALERFPSLQERLKGSIVCSAPRGAVSCHRTLRSVSRGNAALVGDASGSVDAITGEGLSLAFAQAVSLGKAMRRDNLRIYEEEHAELMRPARLMSHALLAMGAAESITTGCITLLRWIPGLFSGLLRLHTRSQHGSSASILEMPPVGTWNPTSKSAIYLSADAGPRMDFDCESYQRADESLKEQQESARWQIAHTSTRSTM
jgi:hypothetical protein